MTVVNQRLMSRVYLFIFFLFAFNSQLYAKVLDPQADMYRGQGLAEQERGHYQNALNFFLKAASMSPDNAVLYNDIGINYENLGHADRAEQYYLRALKVDSGYLPAYSNLAYLYKSVGNVDQAKRYFVERLKRASPNDPWKDKITADLYDLDPSYKENAVKLELEEKARQLAEEAAKKEKAEFTLSVERAEKHFKRAEKLRSQKKYKDAVEEFDHALKATPDNPKILKAKERAIYEERIDEVKHRIAVATEELNKGQVESAKKEFQHILAIIPKESVQNN